MQGKNFTHEPFANHLLLSKLNIHSSNGESLAPPIVCLVIRAGEAAAATSFFRPVLGIPGAVYLVMETGIALHKGPELLRVVEQTTLMPVVTAEQGMALDANQVYVIPHGFSVSRAGERVLFRAEMAPSRGDGAVDLLLAAVATVAPDRHIVLLSQGITDQVSGGLRIVRSEGGFVIAYTDDDIFLPLRPGLMPADLVLTSAEMAAKVRLLVDEIGKNQKLPMEGAQAETELAQIYMQLLRNRGMDFARRRQPEILRRIRRRMMIHGVNTLAAYTRLLEEEAEEIALSEELRISLTGFFLDATLEHALLNEVLPRLLENHIPGTPLRIWIPCCCGGHEAYALAIFISEYIREQKKELTAQIFATDVNKAASERSRIGIYDQTDLSGLSTRKRKQYFTKSPAGYHINRQIREMCVFATQNLFKDPPFSNVDLILGFSALRGLHAESLDKIMRTFHYALRPVGFLVSDDPEIKTGLAELFQRIRTNPSVFMRRERVGSTAGFYPMTIARMGEREADALLLNEYVPPTLLVDDQLRVVRFYGIIEPYLRFSQDRLNLHLLRMVRDELVFELEELMERSKEAGSTVVKNGIHLNTGANARDISVEVTPLRPNGGKWKLVIIREITGGVESRGTGDKNSGRTLAQKDERIQALEKEVGELRTLLAAAGEDATRIQEALQVANEEIMASNEELQSVNEQLQSVNQQLLSFNVELNTVNEDLSVRNQELEVSAEYAQSVVGSLRRPVLVLQDDLRIKLANEIFCSFFGATVDDTQGQSLYTVANGLFDRDELRKALRQMLTKKAVSVDLELRVELGERGERVLAITVSRMPKTKNNRPGLVLSLEDITERRAAERFKDEFIGIASHELKTPATSIQAYSQLLTEGLTGTRDLHSAELATKLSNQVVRLTRLTKDLLDVTRISSGQVDFKKEKLDLLELINEAVEELQVTTAIRLVITEHPLLPHIKGDRERLRQVLVNLLSNAIKYAPETPEIIVRPGISEDKVSVAIQDFGAGISTESLRKIFDRYYRLEDGRAGGYPGVGLGLYISSEIIRYHGGEIKVNSEKNKGSIFTITLPVD